MHPNMNLWFVQDKQLTQDEYPHCLDKQNGIRANTQETLGISHEGVLVGAMSLFLID